MGLPAKRTYPSHSALGSVLAQFKEAETQWAKEKAQLTIQTKKIPVVVVLHSGRAKKRSKPSEAEGP